MDLSNAHYVTTTGTQAFNKTQFQGDLVLGSGFVSIKYGAFSNIPFNGTLDLSNCNNLELIDTNSFTASKFPTIILPAYGKLKTIGTSAFQNTTTVMTNLYIPKSVETISQQAFSGDKFNNIYIPISVTFIGGSAFWNATAATIYYEGSSIPSEWAEKWNFHNRPVVLNAVF